MPKRVMVISDLHCGHLVGLTPPSRHAKLAKNASNAHKKLEQVRQDLWKIFQQAVESRPKPDILIVNGDATDGTQYRSGGSELLHGCADMDEQCDIAAECIKFCKAKQIYMTHGTPYHTATDGTDHERQIAKLVRDSKYTESCVIKSHLYLDVNGLIFDCKHKLGSSGVQHGRRTALERDRVWSILWADAGVTSKADIYIRSHVHYAGFCGGVDYLCLTTPALQGLGSKYGSRQCSGLVDWGFTWFEVSENGEYTWEFVTPRAANQKQRVEVIKA